MYTIRFNNKSNLILQALSNKKNRFILSIYKFNPVNLFLRDDYQIMKIII